MHSDMLAYGTSALRVVTELTQMGSLRIRDH